MILDISLCHPIELIDFYHREAKTHRWPLGLILFCFVFFTSRTRFDETVVKLAEAPQVDFPGLIDVDGREPGSELVGLAHFEVGFGQPTLDVAQRDGALGVAHRVKLFVQPPLALDGIGGVRRVFDQMRQP